MLLTLNQMRALNKRELVNKAVTDPSNGKFSKQVIAERATAAGMLPADWVMQPPDDVCCIPWCHTKVASDHFMCYYHFTRQLPKVIERCTELDQVPVKWRGALIDERNQARAAGTYQKAVPANGQGSSPVVDQRRSARATPARRQGQAVPGVRR